MLPAHRVEAVLSTDGTLVIDGLPFRAGQAVEVIVSASSSPVTSQHPLRGTVVRYDRPTEPVADAD